MQLVLFLINDRNIRFELIYYSVLKKVFGKAEFELLGSHLQENDRDCDGITIDEITSYS